MRPYPASSLGSRFSALASNNHGARALGTVCQLTNSTAIGQADPRYYWYLHLPHGRGCPHVRATSSQRTECVSLSVRLSLSPRAPAFSVVDEAPKQQFSTRGITRLRFSVKILRSRATSARNGRSLATDQSLPRPFFTCEWSCARTLYRSPLGN